MWGGTGEVGGRREEEGRWGEEALPPNYGTISTESVSLCYRPAAGERPEQCRARVPLRTNRNWREAGLPPDPQRPFSEKGGDGLAAEGEVGVVGLAAEGAAEGVVPDEG